MSRGSFLLSQDRTTLLWSLTSVALLDAYTDFMDSRQSKNATKSTLSFYSFMLGKFLHWAESQGICAPDEITARHVRQFISGLVAAGYADTTVWNHARAIRTMFLFWHKEGYMPALVSFDMPKKAKKRQPILNAEQLQQVLKACDLREKTIVLFMADSGLRREETVKLNWADVNMQNGLVRVKQGKGRKDRSAVISPSVRRALRAYRRTLKDRDDNTPLFRTRYNQRFTGAGLLRMFQRLSKRTGIHVTPHAMRRTFTILALRNGMDVLHLQALGGWESLDLVYHYAQMGDEDLLRAHNAHSPIDGLPK